MNPDLMNKIKSAAGHDKGWALEEARRLLKRVQKQSKAEVLFETGYGPSGLPHIGTFGEVFRTTMVRYGFSLISDIPTRLICFSDDMDGLRKVPDNVPNKEMLQENLHKPLTEVPDPFGTAASFGAHNNGLLCEFLDKFKFDYEFVSSTETYKSGRFDEMLLKTLEKYDEILQVMLPTLGEERRASYSPFLPICPETRHVLQVPIIERDAQKGTILYRRDDGKEVETQVTGGACKLQWKPDWGMRWVALGVDYEMSGKDLSESVILSAKIARILGGTPPEGFSYELFLDQNGQKISKSKGNGLSIEEWLRYAPKESLSYFMYQKPKTAKRLYFDVIPKAVDESLQYLAAMETEDTDENAQKLLANPMFFIRGFNIPEKTHPKPQVEYSPGNSTSHGMLLAMSKKTPPKSQEEDLPVSFSLLLTLVNAGNIGDADTLAGFISQYAPNADLESPLLKELIEYALSYYQDFVAPTKDYGEPLQGRDLQAVEKLYEAISTLSDDAMQDAEEVQKAIFAVGRDGGYEPMRQWFIVLYKSLLGQEQGPRLGTLFAILGRQDSLKLLKEAQQR